MAIVASFPSFLKDAITPNVLPNALNSKRPIIAIAILQLKRSRSAIAARLNAKLVKVVSITSMLKDATTLNALALALNSKLPILARAILQLKRSRSAIAARLNAKPVKVVSITSMLKDATTPNALALALNFKQPILASAILQLKQ